MSLPQTPSGGARLRRGVLAVTAVAFSVLALGACSAGENAQTLGVRPDNAEVSVDSIKIQNAVVITQPQRDTDGPATFSATIFNEESEPQTIDAITLPGVNGTMKLSPAQGTGPVTVPAQGSIILGGKGNASAVLENGRELTKNVGGVQDVVIRFSETGDVKVEALVHPAAGYYQGFGPSVLPKPPAQTPAEPSQSPAVPAEGEHGSEPSDGASEPAEGEAGASGEPGNGESGEPGTPSDSSSASAGGDAEH
ncbi:MULTISPECIES: DUF461 domain-containing protein [unclassified Streptomyces]|uniref:DUF461 domain-containing protein n=1 Tax=unclassified Streptomyces TaxID=2593676 RepID=UPI0033210F2C